MTVTISGTSGITSPPTLNLQAGTTTSQPILLTSGTNLTTAAAGSVEYDGKVVYATPQGLQRGVVPGSQYFRLDAGLAGANVNTAQSTFGVGVTLSGSTVYEFEAVIAMSKSAGTNSHTIGLSFGGGATVNNIAYSVQTKSRTDASFTTVSVGGDISTVFIQTAANTAVTTATATAAAIYLGVIRGTVSINAGGTFIPQYTCSAAPGGAYTTQANSYFLIYPIGASGANTSVGTWA